MIKYKHYNLFTNIIYNYLKAKTHPLSDHEILGTTEKIAMKLGTHVHSIPIGPRRSLRYGLDKFNHVPEPTPNNFFGA